jgi:tRNA dimethylallyltransferase
VTGEPLWILTGPTASGKSALAIEVAERAGAEVVSMDSMAVYRRMEIGTAKPSPNERARVRHHLIDLVEPWEAFDTAKYLYAFDDAVAGIEARGRKPLVAGGTPLYLMAIRKGLFRGPPAEPEVRRALLAEEAASPGTLHRRLAAGDPAAAARIHARDLKRLVRALEVLVLTGRPLTEQQREFSAAADRRPCVIAGVTLPREELDRRIRARAQAMFGGGLLAEVRSILSAGGFSKESAQAIGYAQCLEYLEGRTAEADLIERVVLATRRLVRKQATWFRKMPEIRWVTPYAEAVLAALREG